MSTTRTGDFPIGYRRFWPKWQKDLEGMIAWSKDNDFDFIDVGADVDVVKQVQAGGLTVGQVDLAEWTELISSDADTRAAAVEKNIELINACAALDVRIFFTVMQPADAELPRPENFEHMVAGYTPVLAAAEAVGGRICIEGWPAPGALCCTPETLRAFFEACPSSANAINYDPSHLLRMGINPVRFIKEFKDRVGHVHAKDTEIIGARQYELGFEQPATFAEPIGFGQNHWRYTIPGHGCMHWTTAFDILAGAGYSGKVSIELEDSNFNGSEDTEKAGLVHSRQYLESC